MFGLGPTESIIVFLIVLGLFGAKKLPQIGEGLGKAIFNFKSSISTKEDTGLEPVALKIAYHGQK